MIVKAKFYCKLNLDYSFTKYDVEGRIFIKDKIYEGEYETWSWSDGYRLNNGWKKYWIFDENGMKRVLSRNRFNMFFQELRDYNISSLLKN
jgi:hypothetical protein